jgi:hypothetical protein
MNELFPVMKRFNSQRGRPARWHCIEGSQLSSLKQRNYLQEALLPKSKISQ